MDELFEFGEVEVVFEFVVGEFVEYGVGSLIECIKILMI